MNNKMNDNTHLLYELVSGRPKYKTGKSYVVPSSKYKSDEILSHSVKEFKPLRIQQIGKSNGDT